MTDNLILSLWTDSIYDQDPYIVVSKEGRLFWIIDAYTVSNRLPYSNPPNEPPHSRDCGVLKT
jgi:uncharacterized membrane protein (UPF0182 family)